jgi:Fic family protein
MTPEGPMFALLTGPEAEFLPESIRLLAAISELAGILSCRYPQNAPASFEQNLLYSSIQSTLALENTSVSLEQIQKASFRQTADIPENEARLAANTARAMLGLGRLNPASAEDFLAVRLILTDGLSQEAGRYRSSEPAELVQKQVRALFRRLESCPHPLAGLGFFHRQLHLIQPFSDGCGLMARLWQKCLLSRWHNFFRCLPFEQNLFQHRELYFELLNQPPSPEAELRFANLILQAVREAMDSLLRTIEELQDMTPDLIRFVSVLKGEVLSAAELMERLNMKSRTGFNQKFLFPAQRLNLVSLTIPDKPKSRWQRFYLTGEDHRL